METIQLAISDHPYATALREALLRNGPWQVSCVDKPNPDEPGVIVLDTVTLDQMARPIANPERVVLITRNDPGHLSDAWDAGVLSVVFERIRSALPCWRSCPPGCGSPGVSSLRKGAPGQFRRAVWKGNRRTR